MTRTGRKTEENEKKHGHPPGWHVPVRGFQLSRGVGCIAAADQRKEKI